MMVSHRDTENNRYNAECGMRNAEIGRNERGKSHYAVILSESRQRRGKPENLLPQRTPNRQIKILIIQNTKRHENNLYINPENQHKSVSNKFTVYNLQSAILNKLRWLP